MKSITIEKIKMLWKALTDEEYMVVSLDDWCENAIKWYTEGIKKGKMAKKDEQERLSWIKMQGYRKGKLK